MTRRAILLAVTLLFGASSLNAQQANSGAPVSPATAANQARSLSYAEAAGVNVASSALFFGTTRAAPAIFAKFNVVATATQNGTLTIQLCQDSGCATKIVYGVFNMTAGTTFYQTGIPIVAAFIQVYYTNSSSSGAATLSIFDGFTAS